MKKLILIGLICLIYPDGAFCQIVCPAGSQPVTFGATRNTIMDKIQPNFCVDKYGTLISKLADGGQSVFDVTAFGAVGDGKTDNTAAIQAAVNAALAAGGGYVRIPPGHFMATSASIEAGSANGPGVMIEGTGAGVSKIDFGSSTYGLSINCSIPYYYGACGISRLELDSNNATSTLLKLSGGAPAGSEGAIVANDTFNSPGTLLAFGQSSFLERFVHDFFNGNVNAEIPALGGENIVWDHCVFSHYSAATSTVTIGQNGSPALQMTFLTPSFDGSQLIVNSGQVDIFGGHWEDTATSASSYYGTFGNGTTDATVHIFGGTLNYDGQYASGPMFHVEQGSKLEVSGFQPCTSIAFYEVENVDSGASGKLDNLQDEGCSGFPNHPIAMMGAGVLSQGEGQPQGDDVENVFTQPITLPGGVKWSTGSVAPSGSCLNGSLYSNTSGTSGSTLYACVAAGWVDVK